MAEEGIGHANVFHSCWGLGTASFVLDSGSFIASEWEEFIGCTGRGGEGVFHERGVPRGVF